MDWLRQCLAGFCWIDFDLDDIGAAAYRVAVVVAAVPLQVVDAVPLPPAEQRSDLLTEVVVDRHFDTTSLG